MSFSNCLQIWNGSVGGDHQKAHSGPCSYRIKKEWRKCVHPFLSYAWLTRTDTGQRTDGTGFCRRLVHNWIATLASLASLQLGHHREHIFQIWAQSHQQSSFYSLLKNRKILGGEFGGNIFFTPKNLGAGVHLPKYMWDHHISTL